MSLKIHNYHGTIELDIHPNGKTDVTVTTPGGEEFIGRDIRTPVLAVSIAKRAARRMASPRVPIMSSICNGYNPDAVFTSEGLAPYLLHCDDAATRLLVLDDGADCYTLKLCSRHAQLQRREAARMGVEVVSDEPIKGERWTPN